MNTKLTHGGLFDGIGGFSLGAQRAGIRTKWLVEGNKYRQQILNKHFPKAKLYGKIQSCTNLPYVDIASGGFPCQGISVAGHRKGIADSRSSLWTEFYRIAYESRPRYIIIENSPQLLSAGMEYILHDLSEIGYAAQWKCISAAEFGYRHKRERLFIIAYTTKERFKGHNRMFADIAKIPEGGGDKTSLYTSASSTD